MEENKITKREAAQEIVNSIKYTRLVLIVAALLFFLGMIPYTWISLGSSVGGFGLTLAMLYMVNKNLDYYEETYKVK